jgi:CheY-like chemotaxis protein
VTGLGNLGPGNTRPGNLKALRVLIVEDEMLVAMELEEALQSFGCFVVGPASRIRHALQLATEEEIDAAVLDVNLAGEKVFPVAEVLTRRGVPFVFATGYGAAGIDGVFPDSPILQKPYPEAALAVALADALARAVP